MITLNPAARSCLPRPISNLCWKLWLSLKFARHFIFWWSGESSHNSWSEDKWIFKSLASLSSRSWQQLCTQHAQRLAWMWRRWDCFGGGLSYLSFFQSFSSLAMSFRLTWICNTIQVFAVLCCNCRGIFSGKYGFCVTHSPYVADEWILFSFCFTHVTELECLITQAIACRAYPLVFNDELQTILLPTFVGMLIALIWHEPTAS